jgi:hypothetical protein
MNIIFDFYLQEIRKVGYDTVPTVSSTKLPFGACSHHKDIKLLFDSIKLFNKLALVTPIPVPYRTGIWLVAHDRFYGGVKFFVVKQLYLF